MLAAIFVTIITVKVISIPDFYTWVIVKKISEKQLLFLAIYKGHNSLLIYVTLCVVSYCLLNSGYKALLICLEYQLIKKHI